MAYIVMALSASPSVLPSYGHYSHGLYSHGLYRHGLYNYGLYSYGRDLSASPDVLPSMRLRLFETETHLLESLHVFDAIVLYVRALSVSLRRFFLMRTRAGSVGGRRIGEGPDLRHRAAGPSVFAVGMLRDGGGKKEDPRSAMPSHEALRSPSESTHVLTCGHVFRHV